MTEFPWNETILSTIAAEGTPEIVQKVAKRISDKGFELLDVRGIKGNSEGFNWGRSSHGNIYRKLWNVAFMHNDEELEVVISEQTVTYTKANPYDRMPKDNGKTSFEIRATENVKSVLGWRA